MRRFHFRSRELQLSEKAIIASRATKSQFFHGSAVKKELRASPSVDSFSDQEDESAKYRRSSTKMMMWH